MSKLCPYCKSEKIGSFSDTVYCCMACHRVFGKSQLVDRTVFDKITESVETLAPCFVEKQTDNWDDIDYPYYSYLTKEWYATEDKAIAATIEELKKEYKE